jgi:hypothetical protein
LAFWNILFRDSLIHLLLLRLLELQANTGGK